MMIPWFLCAVIIPWKPPTILKMVPFGWWGKTRGRLDLNRENCPSKTHSSCAPGKNTKPKLVAFDALEKGCQMDLEKKMIIVHQTKMLVHAFCATTQIQNYIESIWGFFWSCQNSPRMIKTVWLPKKEHGNLRDPKGCPLLVRPY